MPLLVTDFPAHDENSVDYTLGGFGDKTFRQAPFPFPGRLSSVFSALGEKQISGIH